jgi:S-adenosylmethionine:diacylglycerol 3-amino-3-carboxypropyl transferase
VSPQTQWQAGRLGGTSGSHRLLFGHMHEDAEIEHEAFRGKGCVFCIASAGCTAMRLSEDHDVVACDINPVQLAYAERRVNGAPPVIGDAERLMSFARLFAPLVGWSPSVVQAFLELHDTDAQLAFWREHLDTRLFRAGFDALLSRAVLRLAYSPQFLTFLPERFGAIFRARLERGLTRHANAANPYARSLLTGKFGPEPARKSSRIQFVHRDAASYLESCAAGSFDAFTLSNILDGAQTSYRDRLFQAVRHAGTENAVVVLRSFGEPGPDVIQNHAGRDRSILWGVVQIHTV